MALNIQTVCNSIAELTVAGVDIKDLDEIPESLDQMDAPVIIPKPDGFISTLTYTRQSLGTGDVAAIDIGYVLTYRMLHSAIGEGMDGVFETYPDLVAKASLFLDTIIANDTITGAVDIQPLTIANFDPVQDPFGNWFHGCDIGIQVTEFVN